MHHFRYALARRRRLPPRQPPKMPQIPPPPAARHYHHLPATGFSLCRIFSSQILFSLLSLYDSIARYFAAAVGLFIADMAAFEFVSFDASGFLAFINSARIPPPALDDRISFQASAPLCSPRALGQYFAANNAAFSILAASLMI